MPGKHIMIATDRYKGASSRSRTLKGEAVGIAKECTRDFFSKYQFSRFSSGKVYTVNDPVSCLMMLDRNLRRVIEVHQDFKQLEQNGVDVSEAVATVEQAVAEIKHLLGLYFRAEGAGNNHARAVDWLCQEKAIWERLRANNARCGKYIKALLVCMWELGGVHYIYNFDDKALLQYDQAEEFLRKVALEDNYSHLGADMRHCRVRREELYARAMQSPQDFPDWNRWIAQQQCPEGALLPVAAPPAVLPVAAPPALLPVAAPPAVLPVAAPPAVLAIAAPRAVLPVAAPPVTGVVRAPDRLARLEELMNGQSCLGDYKSRLRALEGELGLDSGTRKNMIQRIAAVEESLCSAT